MKEAIEEQEKKKKEHVTMIHGREDHSQTGRAIINAVGTSKPEKKRSIFSRTFHSVKEKVSGKYHSAMQSVGLEKAPPEEEQHRNQLTMEEKNKLTKYRGSYFGKVLKKINGWELSQDQRENPPVPEKEGAKENIDNGVEAVKDGVISPMADILSAAGSNAKNVINSLKDGLEHLELFAKVAKRLLSNGKRYLSKKEDRQNMTREEIKKDLDKDLEAIGSIISYIGEKLDPVVTNAPKAGVIVNLVGIIVGGTTKFYKDIRMLFKTHKNIKRMRRQKDIAKRDIYETQEANGTSYVKESKYSDKLKFFKTSEMRNDVSITDQIEKERLESKADSARKNLYIRSMEDYAISKELTGANQKRRNESIFNVIVQELGPVISTAITLAGPGGLLAGSVMNAVLSSMNALKTIKGFAVNIGYKMDVSLLNKLKSPEEKMKKRHRLSVYMFDRLKEIAPLEEKMAQVPTTTYDPQKVSDVRNYLPMRKMQKERITAMGVDEEKMAQSPDAATLLNVMRKGFYRESQ